MSKTFEEVWAEKEAEGYQYGEDALEQVRLGWELRQKEVDELKGSLEASRGEDRSRCSACYASPGNHYGWCELAEANKRILELETEIEGDNGLRASNAAGWAIAKARLEKIRQMEVDFAAERVAHSVERRQVLAFCEGRTAAQVEDMHIGLLQQCWLNRTRLPARLANQLDFWKNGQKNIFELDELYEVLSKIARQNGYALDMQLKERL